MAPAPTTIEVRGLDKSFDIPTHRVDSIKERVLHPLAAGETRRLRALAGVSFDVHQGEFFGVVGRNGTGKSTLLKVLAGIYGADAGTIRIGGRVAPFIELGVGFNVELTARENIVLNGVLVGLTRRQAESRIDSVIEFAELEEFTDMKLKNYSSGMLVRLAFSVMIQSDADILLIDEVLAVGDASFQQKCKDVFHEMRGSDRTVVLVTHDMSAVEQFCHRAMLLEAGEVVEVGPPAEVAERYLRLNFAQPTGLVHEEHPVTPEGVAIDLVEAWLESGGGRVTSVAQGDPLELHAVFEAPVEIPGPSFSFAINNEDGVRIGDFVATLSAERGGDGDLLAAGERVHLRTELVNGFTPGRYTIPCWVHRAHSLAEPVLAMPRIADFVVYGTTPSAGLVTVARETIVRREAGSA